MLRGNTADVANINNLRDVLSTWNRFAESCFVRCASNMNYRDLTEEELKCTESCAMKFVSANQRMIQTFMQIQTRKQAEMVEQAQQKEAVVSPVMPGLTIPTAPPEDPTSPAAGASATDIPAVGTATNQPAQPPANSSTTQSGQKSLS